MKKAMFSVILTLVFGFIAYLPISFAQDYTTWGSARRS